MPKLYTDLKAEVVNPDSNTADMTEYITVGEALKFVALFKGEKGVGIYRECRRGI
jgi:hypothetical protein